MGLFDDSFPYLSVISVAWDLGCRWVCVSYHFPCFLHIVTGPKLSGSSDSSHFSFLSGERMLLKKLLGEEGGFCLSLRMCPSNLSFLSSKISVRGLIFRSKPCSRRVKGFICPSVYVFIGVVALYVCCVISNFFVSF